MNIRTLGDWRELITHRFRVAVRHLDPVRRVRAFSAQPDDNALQRIYVINLDRKPKRWSRMRSELARFRERHGQPLTALTRRFSAVDARYLQHDPDPRALDVTFTLAEQLAVHANPLLVINEITQAVEITMTRQEQAVAFSHIEVWKLIANGDVPSVLVLEDDVVFAPDFANGLASTWDELSDSDFDLLYLAYRDVSQDHASGGRHAVRRHTPGIWEAAGYVLSKEGAQKLLDSLPVRGPVDLWMNMRFGDMKVYTSSRRLIEQRVDEPSTNSYSVLPVLSRVGAVTREKPLLPTARALPGPVIATGRPGSGLSSLAEALSMLGYSCLSDVERAGDDANLFKAGKRASFNAFVNVGDIDAVAINEIARTNRRALFISTDPDVNVTKSPRHLTLSPDVLDKWSLLTDFLDVDYPPFDYPTVKDRGQRPRVERDDASYRFNNEKWDRSPWIREGVKRWPGYELSSFEPPTEPSRVEWRTGQAFDQKALRLRDDTFPSNLALFTPENVRVEEGGTLDLLLTQDPTPVREYAAGAIASEQQYLYGSFAAALQPSRVSGLITGLFLHRNSPRQEIDIEFLGKDTTKMLVNVFYNPGPEGTKLEYGYRGTPTLIDLGFDASAAPHNYEIEWLPDAIIWRVDGRVVYERRVWGPTPIPDQPLEFNINLWHSRSVEFAGRLESRSLPARTSVSSLQIEAWGSHDRYISQR